VTCNGLFSSLLEIFDLIFCGRDCGVWENMRDASRFISHHEEEWGGVMGVVFSVIVDEFCHGEVLNPFERCRVAVDVKISFKFLVQTFGLSISLGVICGGEGNFIVEESSKFFGEFRGELGTSIRDDFVIKTKSQENFLEKQLGTAFRSDGFLAR
jgi:hypothetical protein